MYDPAENMRESQALPFFPQQPMDLPSLDIPRSLAVDIMLRTLYFRGSSDLRSLSASSRLSFPIVNGLFQKLRQQHLFEVTGMEGNNYQFTLTSAGRDMAEKRLRLSQYVGPAPVSLETYQRAVKEQPASPRIHRGLLEKVFGDLVLTEKFLDELGPALVSQSSLFLYGSTGGGKTSIASRLPKIFGGDLIVIPHAVEVDGQVILVFDPALHKEVKIASEGFDPRWVVCRRPCVTVGGELDLSMLELHRDDVAGVYTAPPQMKANQGIFVIDDFGRQIVSPQYLLNRWIVPLDRRVDYLTLSYGMKFEIPFELMVVFATNLEPSQLADEAFFRRIRNKVFLEAITPAHFDEVFRRLLGERGLEWEEKDMEVLRRLCADLSENGELRACYPGDILDIVASVCIYEDRPLQVDAKALERAANIYFTRTRATA